MRRSLTVLLLAGAGVLLGCPPELPPGHATLPQEEEPPHPPPPKKTHPAADDKPAVISSETIAQMMSQAAATGVITALPHLKVFLRGDKRIEIEGATAIKIGPQLELLACSQRGKAYESLLIWLCEPKDLHLALLMIGLTPTPQIEQFGERTELKKGEKVTIFVEWEDPESKKKVKRRAEDLLFDIYRDGCMKYSGWVFTGSRQLDVPQPPDWETTKKQYASDVTGTIAVTYHDPDAILDTPLKEGGNNTTFVAWEQRLPERHTLCTTTIRPWKEGDEKEPEDALRKKGEPKPTGGGPPGGGGPMGGGDPDDRDREKDPPK